MYILDTDHLSVLDRGGKEAQSLVIRLANTNTNPNDVAVTIISYEEQVRGWLDYISRNKTVAAQVEAYKQIQKQLNNYCTILIIEFDEQAAQIAHFSPFYIRLQLGINSKFRTDFVPLR